MYRIIIFDADGQLSVSDDGEDDPPETDDSVMHSGFQDPLEREMGLYKSLPVLTFVLNRSYTLLLI